MTSTQAAPALQLPPGQPIKVWAFQTVDEATENSGWELRALYSSPEAAIHALPEAGWYQQRPGSDTWYADKGLARLSPHVLDSFTATLTPGAESAPTDRPRTISGELNLDWRHHEDGSRCPETLISKPTAPDGSLWWCTTHQMHLVGFPPDGMPTPTPGTCGRPENHLAHTVPMTLRCGGVGPQMCDPERYQHLGPFEPVPGFSSVDRCAACGTEIGK